MHVRANKERLNKALKAALPTVSKKTTLPVLSHFLLTCNGDGFTIKGTDLEVFYKIRIPSSEIREEGQALVPAHKFFEIVNQSDVDVEIITDPNMWSVIKSGNSKVKLAGMDPEDFPSWEGQKFNCKTYSAESLHKALKHVLYAASNDVSRFNLSGVCFDLGRIITTDGHRLSTTTIEPIFNKRRLIPKRACESILKATDGVKEDINVLYDEKSIGVEIGNSLIIARLIDGDFPDYTKVIPSDDSINTTVLFDVDRMKLALKRTGVLTSDNNRGINMSVSGEAIRFVATNPDLGSAEDSFSPIDFSGTSFEIIINCSYLLDALSVIQEEQASIRYIEDEKPLLVSAEESPNHLDLVMPMYK